MPSPTPPTTAELHWQGDLRFDARSGDAAVVLDSASKVGPSPMQALAFALAGCMAMDVVHIITKGRHPIRGLRVSLTGDRAPEEPRRFTRVRLHFMLKGDVPEAAVARALELSKAKFCSVWHSMRQDIELVTDYSLAR